MIEEHQIQYPAASQGIFGILQSFVFWTLYVYLYVYTCMYVRGAAVTLDMTLHLGSEITMAG